MHPLPYCYKYDLPIDRIPPDLRNEWNAKGKLNKKLDKPDIDFEVEWVYGYRGKVPSGGRNIYQVF